MSTNAELAEFHTKRTFDLMQQADAAAASHQQAFMSALLAASYASLAVAEQLAQFHAVAVETDR